MAKAAKSTNDNQEKPAKAEFAIGELAAELGLDQHATRILLRKLGIEKNDGRYRWNKKSEFDAVVKQMQRAGKDEAKSEKKVTKKAA